jgi:hypothetical protein
MVSTYNEKSQPLKSRKAEIFLDINMYWAQVRKDQDLHCSFFIQLFAFSTRLQLQYLQQYLVICFLRYSVILDSEKFCSPKKPTNPRQ